WLCERRLDRSFLTSALAMLPGTLIIYLIGVTWLAVAFHLGPLAAIQDGMLPFIPGDLLKLVIAAALLPATWTVTRRVKSD
ncbi:MAG TPA: biotin transporter BioY, partial [Ktedonobacteraceae bacterium]|nr:biotin transporter BioY [Ktedonobacteraceae bacterium]